jgi:hypothetical protein
MAAAQRAPDVLDVPIDSVFQHATCTTGGGVWKTRWINAVGYWQPFCSFCPESIEGRGGVGAHVTSLRHPGLLIVPCCTGCNFNMAKAVRIQTTVRPTFALQVPAAEVDRVEANQRASGRRRSGNAAAPQSRHPRGGNPQRDAGDDDGGHQPSVQHQPDGQHRSDGQRVEGEQHQRDGPDGEPSPEPGSALAGDARGRRATRPPPLPQASDTRQDPPRRTVQTRRGLSPTRATCVCVRLGLRCRHDMDEAHTRRRALSAPAAMRAGAVRAPRPPIVYRVVTSCTRPGCSGTRCCDSDACEGTSKLYCCMHCYCRTCKAARRAPAAVTRATHAP